MRLELGSAIGIHVLRQFFPDFSLALLIMATHSRQPAVPAGVVVLVGTTKGAFVLHSTTARQRWTTSGPHFRGHAVYAIACDTRGAMPRLWASTQSMHWGALLASSDNLGESWTVPTEATLKFPQDAGLSLKQIWQICPTLPGDRQRLLCGVEPAALFESRDGGASWSPVSGLLDHPHRRQWQPGGGGLCLHTILCDPTNAQRILVAISTGGVYRTDDGGRSWRPRNVGIRAEFLPNKYPEFGQCVHKVVHHPARPERLFLQNHWGLYRSDDWGDSWRDIANGVPSDFGFAMEMHPHDPDTLFILPLESDAFRCVPEARLRVYRTQDAGASWKPLTRGLPQTAAYETVLRDAMAADRSSPAGIYFGTRTGKLYASSDAGNSWRLLAGGLPPIVCVKTAVVGNGARRATAVALPPSPGRKQARSKSARKQSARKRGPKKTVRKKASTRVQTGSQR
ncbi:MAG: exo-alpha-sialidase [Gemmatimonadaceae bacterium]